MRTLILVASMVWAGLASAETFTLDLEGVPADEASIEDCRAVARTIGAQFANNAGVEAVGLCLDISDSAYDIQIRYDADERLRPISTTRAGFSMGGHGFFATREECEAVLADEADVFTAQTGLTPLFDPYCFDEGGFENDTPWMFRIDGLGEAAVLPRLESATLWGQVLGYSRSTFFAGLMEGLANTGLEARHIRLDSSFGYGNLSIFLYSEDNHRIESGYYAKLNSVEACEAELARFNAAVEGTDTLITFCAAQHVGGRAEVSGLFLDVYPFGSLDSLEVFADYESCTAGRDSVIAGYRADGLDIADGLCSLNDDNQWFVALLER